jgi:hypothetical protein
VNRIFIYCSRLKCKDLLLIRIATIFFSLTYIFTIQGCSSVSYSYLSALSETEQSEVLYMNQGESTELLAISNGFPGWWGFYPVVRSSNTSIASVECNKGRGYIPFRDPGIIFGGEVCNLIGYKPGKITLLFGSEFSPEVSKQVEAIIIKP